MSAKNIAVLVVVTLVVLVSLVALLSGGGMMGWGAGSGMMGWSGNGFSGLGIGMMLFGTLVIGAIAWLMVSIISPSRLTTKAIGAGRDRPLDIVKERYARGELTREEYAQMRKEIEG